MNLSVSMDDILLILLDERINSFLIFVLTRVLIVLASIGACLIGCVAIMKASYYSELSNCGQILSYMLIVTFRKTKIEEIIYLIN